MFVVNILASINLAVLAMLFAVGTKAFMNFGKGLGEHCKFNISVVIRTSSIPIWSAKNRSNKYHESAPKPYGFIAELVRQYVGYGRIQSPSLSVSNMYLHPYNTIYHYHYIIINILQYLYIYYYITIFIFLLYIYICIFISLLLLINMQPFTVKYSHAQLVKINHVI